MDSRASFTVSVADSHAWVVLEATDAFESVSSFVDENHDFGHGMTSFPDSLAKTDRRDEFECRRNAEGKGERLTVGVTRSE